MIGGILAVGIGINISINGFPNLTNAFLKHFASVTTWGIGAYLILAPAMNFFEKWRGRE